MPSRNSHPTKIAWDRAHRRTVGTQVSREEAEAIKAFASRNGETVGGMIKRLIRDEMSRKEVKT